MENSEVLTYYEVICHPTYVEQAARLRAAMYAILEQPDPPDVQEGMAVLLSAERKFIKQKLDDESLDEGLALLCFLLDKQRAKLHLSAVGSLHAHNILSKLQALAHIHVMDTEGSVTKRVHEGFGRLAEVAKAAATGQQTAF